MVRGASAAPWGKKRPKNNHCSILSLRVCLKKFQLLVKVFSSFFFFAWKKKCPCALQERSELRKIEDRKTPRRLSPFLSPNFDIYNTKRDWKVILCGRNLCDSKRETFGCLRVCFFGVCRVNNSALLTDQHLSCFSCTEDVIDDTAQISPFLPPLKLKSQNVAALKCVVIWFIPWRHDGSAR